MTLSPSSIASTIAFGNPVLSGVGGAQTLVPTGLASTEVFGTTTIDTTITTSPSSITTAEAEGTPTVTVGALTVSPSAIASVEGMGDVTVTPGAVTLTFTPPASEEAFGTPLIDQPGLGLTVNMSGWGIESGEHMAHFYDVQKDNLNRPVAGLVKGHREHEYRLNGGKNSNLENTHD